MLAPALDQVRTSFSRPEFSPDELYRVRIGHEDGEKDINFEKPTQVRLNSMLMSILLFLCPMVLFFSVHLYL